MKRRTSWFLIVAMLAIAVTSFAITPEIRRIAYQADRLYVQSRYGEAFPLMKRAAEGGDLISMFNLGTMYYQGQGTTKNIGEARRWWQEAANNGDSLAKEMLKRLDAKQVASRPRTNQTFTVNGVSFVMIFVEGGSFTMGAKTDSYRTSSDDDRQAHEVTLSDFSIGQTEVTQALWLAVMGSNPSNFKGNFKRPVETVSWNDCQEFIARLNTQTGQQFRLPTEAEWEYAARGGNKSHGYEYSGSIVVGDIAWHGDNSKKKTHAVATKKANELGLYDMSGNVWEWCQDWRGSYSSGALTNPTGPAFGSSRVYRGGSMIINGPHYWTYCSVSYRGGNSPSYRNSDLGFRLAL